MAACAPALDADPATVKERMPTPADAHVAIPEEQPRNHLGSRGPYRADFQIDRAFPQRLRSPVRLGRESKLHTGRRPVNPVHQGRAEQVDETLARAHDEASIQGSEVEPAAGGTECRLR